MKKIQWMIGLVIVLVGVGIVVSTLLPKSMQYYVTVKEFLPQKAELQGKTVKVAGKVEAGSILKKSSTSWNMIVFSDDAKIPVEYQGALPDSLKDLSDVVVTGQWTGTVFTSSEILAKCASKYEEKLTPKL